MHKYLAMVLVTMSCLLVTGCAVSVTEVRVDTSALSLKENKAATKSVYVRRVTDDREFNSRTRDPSVPSTEFSTPEEGV